MSGLEEESKRPRLYVWFDAEFTSLVFEEADLLQVALVATDTDLRRVGPAEEDVKLIVRLDPGTPLSPWVREHLADLVVTCRSDQALPRSEVDARLESAVDRAARAAGCTEATPPILAGNSVHADAWIARRLLPRFYGRLHYRHLDVTSFKLAWLARGETAFAKDDPGAVRTWFPEARLEDGGGLHDAYFDVQASIAEMACYRARLLRP